MAKPLVIGMPQQLDVAPGYTIRVTAIDQTTGALVTGVNVGTVVITADNIDVEASGGTLDLGGDWFLVPGPGA